MTKFKVGDLVTLNKIENIYGEDHSERHELPMQVRIRAIEGDMYDYSVETLDGDWLSSVYEKNLESIPEVVKQVTVRVKAGSTVVHHTTNTRRKLIVIGGKRTIDDLDNLIVALQQLKEEL